MFYRNVVVNGYDSDGGLWFSQLFTGNHQSLEEVIKKATEDPVVVEIRVSWV